MRRARGRHARVHRRRDPPRRRARVQARARRASKRVTSVDKANVLESSRLWREVATEVARATSRRHARAPARRLVRDAARSPHARSFDVIVTENMFGDILTDEAAVLAGSLGLLPERVARRRHAAASTSRSTARRPTSPARASPTRSARSSAPRCCCATRSASPRRPTRSSARSRSDRRRRAHGRHGDGLVAEDRLDDRARCSSSRRTWPLAPDKIPNTTYAASASSSYSARALALACCAPAPTTR